MTIDLLITRNLGSID